MGKLDLTYLTDGVLVKDQPAGLVAPKKSIETNISVDLAKEAIDTLVEQGLASPCKVPKGRGNRELDGLLPAHLKETE